MSPNAKPESEQHGLVQVFSRRFKGFSKLFPPKQELTPYRNKNVQDSTITPHPRWSCADLTQSKDYDITEIDPIRPCKLESLPSKHRATVPKTSKKPPQKKAKPRKSKDSDTKSEKKRRSRIRHKGIAHDALQCVLKNAPGVTIAFDSLHSWQEKARAKHESKVLCTKRLTALHRGSCQSLEQFEDRLSFICSSLAIARDYQAFQRDRGVRPDPHTITRSLTTDSNFTGQSHEPEFQKFLEAQGSSQPDREALSVSLRLGTKLQLVDAIANSLKLGSSLTLLFGEECRTLLKLPYKTISSLRHELTNNTKLCSDLKTISQQIDEKWTRFANAYRTYCFQTLKEGEALVTQWFDEDDQSERYALEDVVHQQPARDHNSFKQIPDEIKHQVVKTLSMPLLHNKGNPDDNFPRSASLQLISTMHKISTSAAASKRITKKFSGHLRALSSSRDVTSPKSSAWHDNQKQPKLDTRMVRKSKSKSQESVASRQIKQIKQAQAQACEQIGLRTLATFFFDDDQILDIDSFSRKSNCMFGLKTPNKDSLRASQAGSPGTSPKHIVKQFTEALPGLSEKGKGKKPVKESPRPPSSTVTAKRKRSVRQSIDYDASGRIRRSRPSSASSKSTRTTITRKPRHNCGPPYYDSLKMPLLQSKFSSRLWPVTHPWNLKTLISKGEAAPRTDDVFRGRGLMIEII